ncbi:MAG: Rpn family recombination-promoting nuclease/putative transposase [Bacteroidales bacterium]|nr:Rpn family recombination-promoting nuclease/putative transposase [Bacteroidales bacterium]
MTQEYQIPPGQRYASLMTDSSFKRAFVQWQDGILTKLLLRELIPERTLKEIRFLPTEHTNPIPGMKDIVVDVECTDEEGAKYIVEMQLHYQAFFSERMVYYSAAALLEELRKGGDGKDTASFYDYPPVYVVALLNFSMHGNTDKVLFTYQLLEKDLHDRMTDRLNFVYLEMPNYKGNLKGASSVLQAFSYVMRNFPEMRERPEGLKEDLFRVLFDSAEISKFRPDERIKYVHDMTTERDIRNQILTARNQGIQQGIQQGKEEAASNLLKLGIDIGVVSKATGLDVEQINALRAMPPDKMNNQ